MLAWSVLLPGHEAWPEEAATAAAPTADELRHTIDALVVDERWQDAIVAAEQLVKLEEEQSGPKALAVATPLTQLGDLQYRAGNFKAAESSYARAIGIVESHVGTLNARLIDPLRGLGFTYAAMEDHPRATVVLERGVLTARRNQGLFDPRQMDMLAQLAESQTQIGALESAEQNLKYLVRIAEKAYGTDDPRVAVPISRLARWYSRTAAYEISRGFYLQAIERVEKAGGPDDVALVEPLRGLAENAMRAFLLGDPTSGKADESAAESLMMAPIVNYADPRPGNRRNLTAAAEEALERGIGILDGSVKAGKSSPIDVARTLIQAGDWYMAKGEVTTAQERYARAWTQTHQDGNLTPVADKSPDKEQLSFAAPVQIFIPLGSTAHLYQDRSPDDVVEQDVVAEFAVRADGTVRDVKVLDSDAGKRKTNLTVSALEQAIYRPRMENGHAVDTTGVLYRQVYRTLPDR
jgi:tetratricopeptide (TPR) repeat protein